MKRVLLEDVIKETGILVIDGAMSTALEQRGFDTSGSLWTARALIEQPELIRQVHMEYFRAGADCGISCSYQASVPGFLEAGLTHREAERLIRQSVQILRNAREEWWQEEGEKTGRAYPLCAASVGPYGAYLADSSEYSGIYSIEDEELRRFHESRMALLWNAGADLLVIETQPSMREVRIETEIAEALGAEYWISFTCPEREHLYTGERLDECVKELSSGHPHLRMVGVNCVPPRNVKALIQIIKNATDLPVAVYPNSGERFDPVSRTWHRPPAPISWKSLAEQWIKTGASAVGGCCRTTEKETALTVAARTGVLQE